MEKTNQRTSIVTKLQRRWVAIVLALTLCTISGGFIAFHRIPTWTQIDLLLDWRFSDITSISTGQLEDLLAQTRSAGKAAPLLIDVRTAQEFAISHLPHARHVESDLVLDFAERELSQLDRAYPIVVYCSVGVRSAVAARDLKLAGFTQVKNLRGSIFQWANEGRPLQAGQSVHPYNSQWGRLLRADLHAPY